MLKTYKEKLDQKRLKGLKADEELVEIWDTEIKGLVFRMYPGGAKTYSFVYRMGGRGHNSKWLKLGTFESLPLIRMRERAIECRAKVNAGIDPKAELEKKRAAGLTLADVASRFIEEHVKPNLALNSQNSYISSIRTYILPKLGRTPIKDLSRADVDQWFSKIKANAPVTANRALAHLSSICTKAEIWELRPQGSNPCMYVQRTPEVARKRDIEPRELEAVGKAMGELEGSCNPFALAAIKVIGLCAGRISEVLGLKWDADLHLNEGYALVRVHKTSKTEGAKYLELPQAAVDIIKSLPRVQDSPWVFPTRYEGQALTRHGVRRIWSIICERAEIENLHLHDFRSFAASEGLDQGISPQIAATVLGHKDSRTTEKHYQKPRRRATAEAAEKIFAPVAKAFGLEQGQNDEQP
jgi:integrase